MPVIPGYLLNYVSNAPSWHSRYDFTMFTRYKRLTAWFGLGAGSLGLLLFSKLGNTILTLVGLAGLPDDLNKWVEWAGGISGTLSFITATATVACGAYLVRDSIYGPRSVISILGMTRRKWLVLKRPKRDASLAAGLFYLVYGLWIDEEDNSFLERFDDRTDAYHDALPTIRQAALDGEIRIWGRLDGVWHQIPKEFWAENKFDDHITYWTEDEVNVPPYEDLKCSKAEFESVDWRSLRVEWEVVRLSRLKDKEELERQTSNSN